MFIYVYICIYMSVYMYICVYIVKLGSVQHTPSPLPPLPVSPPTSLACPAHFPGLSEPINSPHMYGMWAEQGARTK